MNFAGIVPHKLRQTKDLGGLKIQDLIWPFGAPHNIEYVRDLSKNDHIAIYPYSKTILRRDHGVNCHVSLIFAEPKAIQGLYYRLIPIFKNNYTHIFTRYHSLSKRIKNAVPLQVARSSLTLNDLPSSPPSKKGISLIASKKKQTTGHKLRHKLIEEIRKLDLPVDILGRGYAPFDKATEALSPYEYSVVIENAQEENYFTEKILDCLLNKTVPIYWGSEDINHYFNTTNWLIFNNKNEGIKQIQQALTNHRIDNELVEYNYQQALSFLSPDDKYAEVMLNKSTDKKTS